MEVIKFTEDSDIARVYIAKSNDKFFEFVESTQPPLTFSEKWVLIISTLFGCPVNCSFCDCSYYYAGKLNKEEILAQIEYPIKKRFNSNFVNTDKFKIQFARMGEPSFNDSVIDVLKEIPYRFSYKYFIPSLSTIAPMGREKFFEKLLKVKKELYDESFQLQFSIHTTDIVKRDKLVPVKKWSFEKIANYGKSFYSTGGKKITLNFALNDEKDINIEVLTKYFDPEYFLIKLTPINPTYKMIENKLSSFISKNNYGDKLIKDLENSGFKVILSIGEWEENNIGSNCGQFLMTHLKSKQKYDSMYRYKIIENV